ncbi:hypothetical protein NDU88_011406 [Pleurodeles waltl]|uniref:Uncharacterized protein n=1 Tax=Pleurodeles waltl TaxID=8319 RepID=A0AAV7S6S6_PLEWA|nr:hypothetical protein NDU88_011406 [Pleurodeles waltl]
MNDCTSGCTSVTIWCYMFNAQDDQHNLVTRQKSLPECRTQKSDTSEAARSIGTAPAYRLRGPIALSDPGRGLRFWRVEVVCRSLSFSAWR